VWYSWWRGELGAGFWWGNLREEAHLEDPGISGRIILRWIFRKWDGVGGMNWIYLVQVGNSWQAVVNVVMNLQVP
jgi:hypothetical protein